MGGSSRNTNQSQYTDQTTQSSPWAPAQGSLQTALDAANNAYQNTYNGSSVAAKDPLVNQGQAGIVANANQNTVGGLANGVASNFTDLLAHAGLSAPQTSALGALNPYMNGDYLKSGGNPYLDSTIKAAQDQAAAGVNSQFSAAGRYGSGAQSGELATSLGNIGMNARMQDYSQQQQNQLQAAQAAAGIGQQGIANVGAINSAATTVGDAQNYAAKSLMGVGADNMNYQQQVINAANQDPWTRAGNLAQLAGGIGQLGGVSHTTGTSNTNQTQTSNPGVFGDILAGVGAVSNLFGGGGGGGSGSSPASNIARAFSFSDARLKENIEKVGRLDDGQNVYAYNFKGSDAKELGLLAQEVEKVKPEAVLTRPDGIKMVHYGLATSKKKVA